MPRGGVAGTIFAQSAPGEDRPIADFRVEFRYRPADYMFTTFVLSLAGGMLVMLATGRQEQISWRFVRLIALLVFAMACLVTTSDLRESGWPSGGARLLTTACGAILALGAAAVVMAAPGEWRMSGGFRWMCLVGGAAGVGAGCVSVVADSAGSLGTPVAVGLAIVGQALGALLLGSTTTSWLLGHAYLTATKMTIAPLRQFSRMLSFAVAARAAFVAASLGAAWLVGVGDGPTISVLLANSWLVLSLRLGVGIVAVGAFAYMVADCVRLRSTQSATGILYFGSIFTYIGELASLQLLSDCGWPL